MIESKNFSTSISFQPIYSLGGWSKPDVKWLHIDSNGHSHKFIEDKLPSLDYIPAITELVSDEYDEYEEEIEPSYYKCKLCGEKVIPEYVADTNPIYLAEPKRYFIDNIPVAKTEYEAKLREYLE